MKTISVGGGGTVILPNVSFCEDTKDIHYNPYKIIPIEGDIQIFADPECTQYATGSEKTVYVRVNKDFGNQEYWFVSGPTEGKKISIGSQVEGEPFSVYVWIDWMSEDFNTPFIAGQVVECNNTNPQFAPVSNPTVIFSKPVITDSVYWNSNVSLAVNSEGKVIVTEGWNEGTPLSEVTAQYLSISEDGGLRASWFDVKSLEDLSRINYLNQNGYVIAESYTYTSVTIGGKTWDWSNQYLITPVPEEYIPSNR